MAVEGENTKAGLVAISAIVVFVLSFLAMFPLSYLGDGGYALFSLIVSMVSIVVFLVADRLSGREDDGGFSGF